MLADRPPAPEHETLWAGLRKDVGVDFAAAGLLDGLEGPERAAREKLLAALSADGFSFEELRRAVTEDRLALLPVERILAGRYTATEVQERTGLEASMLLRLRRLLGLPEPGPDERVFGEHDVEMARSTKASLEAGLQPEAIAQIMRVVGESMARVAATTAAAFVETYLEPGDSERDVALRFAALAEQLAPNLEPALLAAYHAHLSESVRRGMIGRSERATGTLPGAQELTVCFADMVGFTRLGAELEAQELGSVAGSLAALAADATESPVRLVKTIGDAAMFVSADPGAMVAVALSLIDAVQEAELPAVRAGVAVGPALLRAGDFYGHAVNLASRVTGVARPGSVLCMQEVRDAVPERFAWSFAGRHKLKGVSEPVPLHRARVAAEDGPETGKPAKRDNEHAGAPKPPRRRRTGSRRR